MNPTLLFAALGFVLAAIVEQKSNTAGAGASPPRSDERGEESSAKSGARARRGTTRTVERRTIIREVPARREKSKDKQADSSDGTAPPKDEKTDKSAAKEE